MDVVVFDSEDRTEPCGTGSLRYDDLLVVDDDDGSIVLCTLPHHPHITMHETGRILMGLECWWMPLADFVTINQEVFGVYNQHKPNIAIRKKGEFHAN